jgi:hypothetical protein
MSWQHPPHDDSYGVVPDVSKLREFGCVAFAKLEHPKKLDDKAVRATNLGHIGYGNYRQLLPGPDNKIFFATSVKFDEKVFDFAADAVKEVLVHAILLEMTTSSATTCSCLLTTMKMKMSMPKYPRLRRQSMLKTVAITLAMSKARRWRTFDDTRYGTVHRHRH